MKWKMIEQAEEELQRLEIEHPDNFHVLKMELKSLISLFQDSLSLLLHNTNHAAGDSPSPSASTAPTRGSTCRKRKRERVPFRKKKTTTVAVVEKKSCKSNHNGEWVNKNILDIRVEAALQRAQLCLQKLHAFKTSL